MFEESAKCPVKPYLAQSVPGYGLSSDEKELPDGSCVSPRRIVKSGNLVDDASTTVQVGYAGSFPVVGENQDQRMECVRKRLLEMKSFNKTHPVLLAVSLSGIKVCSHTGESILMAHALKRISYATCHPEFCQFSFLAREPKAVTNNQHCHVFLTTSAQEAEELNSVVASAFSVAYACQRQSQVIYQPTFNELIRHQMELHSEEFGRQQEERLARRLCQIATPLVDQRLEERHVKRLKEREEHERRIVQGKERTTWAKKVFEQTPHRLPFLEDASQTNLSPASSHLLPTGQSMPDSIPRQTLGFADVPRAEADDLEEQKNHCPELEFRSQPGSDAPGGEECYLCPVPCCPDLPNTCAAGSELEFSICHHMMVSSREDLASARLSSSGNLPSSGSIDLGARASPVAATTAPEESTRSRPLSGKYQNDEGITRSSREGSRDSEGRDIYQGPPTPIRHDSLRKMTTSQGSLCDELQEASWYQPGVPREVALEILSQQDIGSFIIRDSTTHPGCYALSVKVPRYDNPSGISHYLITRTTKGSFKIKGLDKEWPTLSSLVTHHTVMRELLPCLLHTPRPSNSSSTKELDKEAGNY